MDVKIQLQKSHASVPLSLTLDINILISYVPVRCLPVGVVPVRYTYQINTVVHRYILFYIVSTGISNPGLSQRINSLMSYRATTHDYFLPGISLF